VITHQDIVVVISKILGWQFEPSKSILRTRSRCVKPELGGFGNIDGGYWQYLSTYFKE